MKNRVLRLAIVAVLVIAMVLTMAACGQKPVESPSTTPTTKPTTQPTTAPTTAPTTTPSSPVVSDDEAELEAKFGITFPDYAGSKVTLNAGAIVVKYTNALGSKVETKFTMKTPDEGVNAMYDAYKTLGSDANRNTSAFTVTAKLTSAVDFDGVKIPSEGYDTTDSTIVVPKAAGIYTVTYTIKVAVAAQNVGLVSVAKESKTYTVTKTYEVAKMAVTVKGEVQGETAVATQSEVLAATYGIYNGASELTAENLAKVKTEMSVTGADAKYSLSVDFITPSRKVAGTYAMPFVAKDAKGNVVETSAITAKDFALTFVDGVRYEYSKADLAEAYAALAALKAASVGTSKPAEIAVGKATYDGLSEVAKYIVEHDTVISTAGVASISVSGTAGWTDAIGTGEQAIFAKNVYDDARAALVADAVKLIDAYTAKVDNSAEYVAFVAYMMGLNNAQTAMGYDSDLAYVKNGLAALDAPYATLSGAFTATVNSVVGTSGALTFAYNTFLDSYNALFADTLTATELATFKTNYATFMAAYDAANDYYKASYHPTAAKTFTKLAATAQGYNAYVLTIEADVNAVVSALDAYKGSSMANTKDVVEEILGYTFGNEWVLTAVDGTFSKYITSANYRYFAKELVAAYQGMTANYVALETAIQAAQNNVAMALAAVEVDSAEVTPVKVAGILPAQKAPTGWNVVSINNGVVYAEKLGDESAGISLLDYMTSKIFEEALAGVLYNGSDAKVNSFGEAYKASNPKTVEVIIANALKDVTENFADNIASLKVSTAAITAVTPTMVLAKASAYSNASTDTTVANFGYLTYLDNGAADDTVVVTPLA